MWLILEKVLAILDPYVIYVRMFKRNTALPVNINKAFTKEVSLQYVNNNGYKS